MKEGKRIGQGVKRAIRSDQERGRKAVLPPILEASEESSSDTEVGLDVLEAPWTERIQVALKDQQPSKLLATFPQSSAHSVSKHSSFQVESKALEDKQLSTRHQ